MMDVVGLGWLFFDMGSTLVDETRSHDARMERALAALRAQGRGHITKDALWAAVTQASRRYEPPFKTVVTALGLGKIPYCCEDERPYPGAAQALEALSRRYKLGVIANQPPGAQDRLEQYGLAPYISLCLGSEDVGIAKPDARIFHMALKQAGCAPEQAAMIGDRLDNDIEPAKRLGMAAIRVMQGFAVVQTPRDARLAPDAQVNDLGELCALLLPMERLEPLMF